MKTMHMRIDDILTVSALARMLTEDGYDVYTITFGGVNSIHIKNPEGLSLPARVESITESEEYFHHHARIGSTEIVWLADKPKVAA